MTFLDFFLLGCALLITYYLRAICQYARQQARVAVELEFWDRLHRDANKRLLEAARRQDARALNVAIRECNLYHRRFCALVGREPSLIPTVPEDGR